MNNKDIIIKRIIDIDIINQMGINPIGSIDKHFVSNV